MKQPRLTLSVAIITLNEERRLGRCLKSIQFTDRAFRSVEIIVVDAGSRDNTAAVARESGAIVFVRPWKGYSDQRNWALHQCSGDWILMLDADEELTSELISDIEVTLPDLPACVEGCWIRWCDFYLGKWMKHGGWSPFQLRLVRKGSAHCTDAAVHEGLRVCGEIIRLQSAVNHYSYDSVRDCVDKADRYSSLAVQTLPGWQRRFWRYHIVTAPMLGFFRMYILRRGFRDGWHGFVASGMSAVHDFLIYVKVWQKDVLKIGEGAAEGRPEVP